MEYSRETKFCAASGDCIMKNLTYKMVVNMVHYKRRKVYNVVQKVILRYWDC